MKICYKCFHTAADSSQFCEYCGTPLGLQNEASCPEALPCGTTLFGRYLIGQVLQKEASFIIYIAQDSRTKGTVAVKEYFPEQYSSRSSMRTVTVGEENRSAFLEGKDLFLEKAEELSDEYDSNQPPCVQSFFNQNDTAYLVIDYGTQENLNAFLEGKAFTVPAPQSKEHAAPDKASAPAAAKTFVPASEDVPLSGEVPASAADESSAPAFSDVPSSGEVPAFAAAESSEPDISPDIPITTHQISPETPVPSRSGSGGRKISLVPVLIIFAIIAAAVIGLLFLVPRVLSGLGGTDEQFHSVYQRISEQIQEQKNKLENPGNNNPFEDIFDGNGDEDDEGDEDDGIESSISGISSGNFFNQGYYILYDGQCIFSDYGGLYRSPANNLEIREKISPDRARYLNEFDGYIYFINETEGLIKCLDPEDNNIYVVYDYNYESEYAPETLYIYEDRFYFTKDSNLFCFDLFDVEEDITLTPEDIDLIADDFNALDKVYESLCFVDGKLVYNGQDGITVVDPYGISSEVISDRKGNLITDGKYIYCWSGVNHIYKISMDGKSTKLVESELMAFITRFNCADDWVYYTILADNQSGLWRVSTDGEHSEFLGPIGEEGSHVLGLCTFPNADYVYIYMYIRENDQIRMFHETVQTKQP